MAHPPAPRAAMRGGEWRGGEWRRPSGLSMGVLYSGAEPVVDVETAITTGEPGMGGAAVAGRPERVGDDVMPTG